MEYRVIVTGTGFDKRASLIRKYIKVDMPLFLEQEPNNVFDPNAIAVYIQIKKFFSLKPTKVKIGYIKRSRAEFFTKKINKGGKILSAYVSSYYFEKDHPRVSIDVVTDWE